MSPFAQILLGTIEHFLSEDTTCNPKFKMAAAILNFVEQGVSSDKNLSIAQRNIRAKGYICTIKCSAMSPNASTICIGPSSGSKRKHMHRYHTFFSLPFEKIHNNLSGTSDAV